MEIYILMRESHGYRENYLVTDHLDDIRKAINTYDFIFEDYFIEVWKNGSRIDKKWCPDFFRGQD